MESLEGVLKELALRLDPRLASILISAPVPVRYTVTVLRKFWLKELQGNVIQTITFLCSLFWASLITWISGVWDNGTSKGELSQFALVTFLTFLLSVGTNELIVNQNKKKK
jgi:hypothetical protein